MTLVDGGHGAGHVGILLKEHLAAFGSTSMAAAQERAMGGASRSGAALSCGGAAGG